MKVLLVSCYELGHQPLGLALPAAHLRAEGVADVECMDLAVEPFDEERVRRADVVAISIPMHTATRIGLRVGRRVRELDPDCHLCYYGLYASLNADTLLDACADSVVGGEYETPLVELVRWLADAGDGETEGVRRARGGADAEAGDAAPTREPAGTAPDGVQTAGAAAGPFFGRQRFRVPTRDPLPPLDRYAHLEMPDGSCKRVGYVEASRGCAHRCRHCPIPPVYEGRLRIVQQEVVLEDVRQLVAMGAGHITFGDPDFLNGVKHTLRIVRRMHEEFPELTFDVTAKVEHLLEHRDRLPELAELGCAFIVSAVESLSDRILEYLDKGHTAADVREALTLTRAAGIPLRPTFVPFTPWTSLDDYLRILEFVETNGLVYHVDPVQYSIRLLVPPGSWLLDEPALAPHLDGLDAEAFVYRWTHPEPRMDALQRQVQRLAAQAASRGEDAATTFYRIRSAVVAAVADREPDARGADAAPVSGDSAGSAAAVTAAASADSSGVPAAAAVLPHHEPAPRLTEAWFC